MILTGENRRIRRKTCPSSTLSTTNSTRTEQGANTEQRGERQVTNRLGHDTAYVSSYSNVTHFQRSHVSRVPAVKLPSSQRKWRNTCVLPWWRRQYAPLKRRLLQRICRRLSCSAQYFFGNTLQHVASHLPHGEQAPFCDVSLSTSCGLSTLRRDRP
jgi:hypothetical protein